MAGLSNEQQENVWALWAKGESIRLIARTIGVSRTPVRTLLHRHGGVKPPPRARNRRRSLTWDRGREMACHDQIAHALGMQVFFCDARSPCQRGTNENTNRLLRQYLAKNADLRSFTQADLNTIAARINERPRKVAGSSDPRNTLFFRELRGSCRRMS